MILFDLDIQKELSVGDLFFCLMGVQFKTRENRKKITWMIATCDKTFCCTN